MINLSVKMDENGIINPEDLSDQIRFFTLIETLNSNVFSVDAELDCLLDCVRLLSDGPSKYMLQLVQAIGVYNNNLNYRHTRIDNYMDHVKEMKCDIVRKRIQTLLQQL